MAATARTRARTTAVTVHPTAIVHPDATLGAGVAVGPYTVIQEHVTIGPRTRIGAHCVLEGFTTIGEDCEVFTGAVLGSIPQDLKYRGEKSLLSIGDRNKIREYVTINPGTEGGGGKTVIGSDCLLMAYSHVAHDCLIGNQVVIANSAALAGHISVEDRAVIGGLVGIHQFVRVGELAIIGGCSRVIQDVPPYAVCVGYPAKVFGLNHEGLKRAGISQERKQVLHHAFRVLFHSKLSMSHALKQVAHDVEPPGPFDSAQGPQARGSTDVVLRLAPLAQDDPSPRFGRHPERPRQRRGSRRVDHGPEVHHLLDFIRQSKRGVCRA